MNNDELIPNVDVPEGESGSWKVERFEISGAELSLFNLRASIKGGRFVKAGTFTRLMRDGEVIMSDTDAEKTDHFWPVHKAKGVILLNGLGLGMVLNACLPKPGVTHATVVEKSSNVIKLVGPHYAERFGDKLTIIHNDALGYTPPKGVRFGMVWHDIWDNICSDNLETMTKLHRRYGKRADWQGSWAKELCQRGR